MKLDDWLWKHRMRRAKFAELIDVSPPYITKLCAGTLWPRRDIAQRILAATKGKVTPMDYIEGPADG